MELVITESRDETGTTTMTLVGSIDLVTRQRIIDTGQAIIERGDSLTMDLGEVSFIDSTGIGALVDLWTAATARDLEFTVSARSDRVARVFEVTGLDHTWART